MQGAPRSVLIVDDDASIRDAIAMLLKVNHIPFLTASNGQEALEIIEQHRPKLVLLDLEMPLLDGPSVVKQLQRSAIQIPVVLMSGAPTLASYGQELGIPHLLPKPFGVTDLIWMMDQALAEVDPI